MRKEKSVEQLAEELECFGENVLAGDSPFITHANMLRQQQAEIEALNRELLRYKSNGEMGYANQQ